MKAEFIISRSGYSTVMDIAALQKKSILIPTPGTNGTGISWRLSYEKQFSFCVNQNNFSLLKILKRQKDLNIVI